MLDPQALMHALEPHLAGGISEGLVLSGGTLSCMVEGMPYSSIFRFELEDPILHRKISGEIPFHLLDWFTETI